MAVNVLLSVGDGDVTDDFDLTPYIVEQGISAPPPELGARTRIVELSLDISAASADALWTAWADVEAKLNQARRARGPYGLGTGVTLSVQLDTTEWVYFDVLDGALALSNLGILLTNNYAVLSLVCLPYARGDAYTVGNLATGADAFDNAAWQKTRSSVTANATTDPDGATTADKLVEDSTASNTHHLLQEITTTTGETYTASVYAKAAERTQVRVALTDGAGATISQHSVNLSTGATLTSSGTVGIEDAGSGWYRIWATGVATGVQSEVWVILMSGGATVYSGDGASGIYLWGGQLDQAATPGAPTLTNGVDAMVTISDVPGDVDALCRLTISDRSTTSKVINRLRIGRRSLPSGMTASDFTGIIDATAVSPGTSAADATAIGGARARVTTSAAWQTIASIAKPVAQYTAGLFNVLVRVRDGAIYPGMPLDLSGTADLTAGGLTSGTWQIKIVALDASLRLSAASAEITVFLTGTGRILLTWTVPTSGSTVTNHRVYFRQNSGSWKYLATGSASGSDTFDTVAGATTADPPTIPSNHPSQLRGQLSLASGTTQSKTRPVYCALSNSQWELVDLGTHPLPPAQAVEAGTPPDWLLTIQGLNTNGTPTLDVDGVWLIPADEAATAVWVDGLALATKRDWIIDTRRDGAVTAYRNQTGTSTEAGGLLTSSAFTLGPGTNVLVLAMDGIDGESDIIDLKATVSARIVPRYRLLRGA